MTYLKTCLPTLETHVVNLKRDAKDCHVTSSGYRFAVKWDLKLPNILIFTWTKGDESSKFP